MRQIITILGFAILGFVNISCDCEEEFLDEYDADFVVEGKVISIENEGEDLLKILITTDESVIEIFTPNDEYMCGYPFRTGEDYIVFGYYNVEDNFYGKEDTYYTTICSYTMSLEEWESIMGE